MKQWRRVMRELYEKQWRRVMRELYEAMEEGNERTI